MLTSVKIYTQVVPIFHTKTRKEKLDALCKIAVAFSGHFVVSISIREAHSYVMTPYNRTKKSKTVLLQSLPLSLS